MKLHLSLETFDDNRIEADLLNSEAYFVSSIFNKYLGHFKVPNTNRLNVELTNNITQPIFIPAIKIVRVATIKWHVNIENIGSLIDKYDRYKFLLNCLLESLVHFGKGLDWPIENLNNAKDLVLKSNFSYSKIIIRDKLSPNKRIKAKLIFRMEEKANVILLEITGKNVMKSIHIFSLVWFEKDYKLIVNNLRWKSTDIIELVNVNSEFVFEYSVKKEKLELHIHPKEKSTEELINELKILDANTPISETQLIYEKFLTKISK